MKLFVSYGHDEHQDFVRRIKGDLEALGHLCWIDSERIHEVPDWDVTGRWGFCRATRCGREA